jgi:hypothetical protein
MLSRTRKFFPNRGGVSQKLPPPREYILKDFVPGITTYEAAPLSFPRTAVPGPGDWVADSDPPGNLDNAGMEVSDGILKYTGSGAEWSILSGNAVTRAAGIAFMSSNARTDGLLYTGFTSVQKDIDTNKASTAFYYPVITDVVIHETGYYVNIPGGSSTQDGTWYRAAIILRDNGFFVARRVEGEEWKLVWATTENSTATLYPFIGFLDSDLGYCHVKNAVSVDLAQNGHTIWGDDYGIATDHDFSPSTGTVLSCEAECLVNFHWDCATGETADIMVRRTDDTHCWIVRCDEVTNTVKLIEVNDGETERGSTAFTFNNGTTYHIHISAVGSNIKMWLDEGSDEPYINYSSATFNQTVGGAKASGFSSCSDFATWPRDIHRHLGSL